MSLPAKKSPTDAPLAERLRPQSWEEMVGLSEVAPALLERLKRGAGRPPSLILWGPPGCGKTTLARLVGKSFAARFVELSGVEAGVKELRAVFEEALQSSQPTILFIDEVHRLNRSQQDVLLPVVEKGTISLIGATTENPSFACAPALLSRCPVIVLNPLSASALQSLALRAADQLSVAIDEEALSLLLEGCAGDARRMLGMIDDLAENKRITKPLVLELLKRPPGYDRNEQHYDVISAFIKSLRGSNPDAALYWGMRMLEGGEDPRFIIRRMMIFASEDIGNADPRALQVAVATSEAFERLGLPEGKIPIAQCITFLATSPKSNRSYLAMHKALSAVQRTPKATVPLHLRNAPTKLMKSLGYGAEYQYPHEEQSGYVAGVKYLPDEVGDQVFYEPSEHGAEKAIKERMAWWNKK